MRGKFFLETYGCQMNASESFSLERELVNRGWVQSADEHEADIVILNTCAVRTSAEQRIHGRIGYYQHLKQSRDLSLVVMGCMTERMQSDLKEQFPTINMLVGTFGKTDFIDFLGSAESLGENRDFFGDEAYEFLSAQVAPGGKSAYVPIMHGCNNFCSYCIVPYVRGREVSREPDEIIREVRRLDSEGVREITLIGQNVNSYRSGSNDGSREIDFARLLEAVESECRSIEWIRFMSSHPKDLSSALIDRIAGSERICSHVHLPVQHGSTEVLRNMNRRYTREAYLELVERIRAAIPGIGLSTDLLIGFPGETEADFEELIDLLRVVRFDDAFTYKYNTRSGTAAASYENQVPEAVKSDRLSRLIDFQRKISEDNKRARVGERVRILVEGPSRRNPEEFLGRTEKNEMVVFDRRLGAAGDFIRLRLTGLTGVTFRAEEE